MNRSDRASATTAEQYAKSHPPGIERHYWYVARCSLLLRELRQHSAHRGNVLDVGCGPGIFVAYLRDRAVEAFGVEPAEPDLVRPNLARWIHTETTIFELPEEFRRSMKTLVLADVLEHLDDPLALLSGCFDAFPNASRVFITLPAHMELWSAWDDYHGHLRRYTHETLAELVSQSPWQLLDSRYWFHSLYAAARLLKVFTSNRSIEAHAPRFSRLHRAVGRALELESRYLPRAAPGSSLFAVLGR